jgi:hypothetical protein
VTVTATVGQTDAGGSVLLNEGVGLAEGMDDELKPPVGSGGVYVMFNEAVGVNDGTLDVMLTAGIVTGIVKFAELLGIVTEMTVPEDTVKLPPVGGMTTVSVTGGLEVMLLDGYGTLAEGVICVKIPD